MSSEKKPETRTEVWWEVEIQWPDGDWLPITYDSAHATTEDGQQRLDRCRVVAPHERYRLVRGTVTREVIE